MFRARLQARLCRGKEGLHRAPTLSDNLVGIPTSATIFILHPLLSTFSSTFVRNIKQQLQGSCARVRRIQNARRRNHLRMVRGGAQGVVTICGWSAAGRRPTPGLQQQLQGSCARARRIENARGRNHYLRMVRGGAQTHTRSAAAAARILRPGPQDPNVRRRNHLRMVRGGAQTHTRSTAVTDV